MANDSTRKIEAAAGRGPALLERFSITLVVIRGGVEGTEFTLGQTRSVVGRGGRADWQIEDDTISKEHAAFEIGPGGIRITDLGSTNGTFVNDQQVGAPFDLKHGDQIRLGDVELQCLIEARDRGPRTFEVS